MKNLGIRRAAPRVAAVVATFGLALTYGATAAWADTSTATAQAVSLTIANNPVVTSGTEHASNDGTQSTVSAGATPALSILGTQSTITAGILPQTAVAFANGSSAACAGLIGAGGQIQIGNDGNCTVVGGGQGGITINLPNAVVIRATAILEECFAQSNGTVSADSQLVDAVVYLGGTRVVTLPVNPAAGTSESAALLSLGLNVQDKSTPGEIKATALTVTLLNTINLSIGNVTCGPNAMTSATSVFPAKSWPIAGGTAAVIALGTTLWYRRRRHYAG